MQIIPHSTFETVLPPSLIQNGGWILSSPYVNTSVFLTFHARIINYAGLFETHISGTVTKSMSNVVGMEKVSEVIAAPHPWDTKSEIIFSFLNFSEESRLNKVTTQKAELMGRFQDYVSLYAQLSTALPSLISILCMSDNRPQYTMPKPTSVRQ